MANNYDKIVCLSCGEDFIPLRRSQVYCSKQCRMVKYCKHEPLQSKPCPLCKVMFTPTNSMQIYCTSTCHNKYRTTLYLPGDIRPVIMETIRIRDNYKCQDCGVDIPKTPDKYNRGHLHHIKPLLTGGIDVPTNIVLLCSNCHSQRHKLIRAASTRSNKASKRVNQ